MLSNNWLTSTTNITFDSNYNVQKISGGNSWHALLNSINYLQRHLTKCNGLKCPKCDVLFSKILQFT